MVFLFFFFPVRWGRREVGWRWALRPPRLPSCWHLESVFYPTEHTPLVSLESMLPYWAWNSWMIGCPKGNVGSVTRGWANGHIGKEKFLPRISLDGMHPIGQLLRPKICLGLFWHVYLFISCLFFFFLDCSISLSWSKHSLSLKIKKK